MDTSCALLFLVAVLSVVYYYLKWPYTHWKKQKVKCVPGTIPAFGHLLPILFSRESSSDLFTKVYRDYEKSSMVGMYFFRTPAVLVREPELVKRVLVSDFQSFQNNLLLLNPKMDPFMSKNPFFCWDEDWKAMRSQMINNMSQKKLKIFFGIMHRVSDKFDDYLSKQVGKAADLEVDIKYVILRLTGELVANTAFGIEGGGFESEISPHSFTGRVENMLKPTFTTIYRQMLVLYLPEFASALGLGFLTNSLDSFLISTVDNIMRHRKEQGLVVDDLLQMIIEASDDLDPKVVAGKLSGYYFDAYETAATMASFACFELSHNSQAQDKARSEIKEILDNYEGTLSYEALKDMKYLEQVIHETIRLYPIIGAAYKVCTRKITLEGSDGQSCCLEPGNIVVVPILGLHTDDEYWENPHSFDPDRFNEEKKNVTKFSFLPFSEGPRMCAGMRYGIMTVKTILATIIKSYTIETSQKTSRPPKLETGSVLTLPAEGLYVKLKRIG
ncbi:probable cytochrome P450 6d5 [Nasonia vitripennis]|uniref:Cytochrome P450 n=1 Tax=Nasonia vitripennis TaxID=7425 RepID=A0A7M7HBW1_NASVI|nr:probable cytochrome P450 6d5 [Nasonia vitripennis]